VAPFVIEAMTPARDHPRKLTMSTRNEGVDAIRVAVQDTGIGVDPSSLDRLFEAFYTTKPNCTGMGLSISRSIVEEHRGRLWAAHNDGPGTTFQFTLPV
jgi:signal transduction histidine kinase